MKLLIKVVFALFLVFNFLYPSFAADPTPIEGKSPDGHYFSIYFNGENLPVEIAIWEEGDSQDGRERHRMRMKTMKTYNNEKCRMFSSGINKPGYIR